MEYVNILYNIIHRRRKIVLKLYNVIKLKDIRGKDGGIGVNKILIKFKSMKMICFALCLMLFTNVCISDFLTQSVSAAIVDESTTYVDEYIPDSILVNILKGLADANKDEKLTIAELRAYKGDENGKLDLKDKGITNVKGLGYASGVKSIDLSDNNSINTIPDQTFMDCINLMSIMLPEGITSIGISAFEGCTSLTSINLPDKVATLGEKSFYLCRSLKSIKLPINIVTIGNSTFSGSGLTSIEIPNANISLGISIFNSCKALTSVKLPEGMTVIPMEFFKASGITGINLPSTINTIEEGAFSESELIGIDLSKCTKLTSIKKSAFSATNLISINLPENLTELGGRAFENCIYLPEITLPSKVTVINELAFSKCISLKNINFMPTIEFDGSSTYNLQEIKTKAFYGCYNLGDENSNVNFLANLDKLTTIGEQAFAYSYKDEYKKDEYNQQVYSGIKSVILPKNLMDLGKGVFKNCYSLNSVNIPDKITILPDETFLNCYNLKNVTLSNILTTIGVNSFNNCYELDDITFPNSLVTIGDYAFLNCAKEKIKTENSQKQYIYTGITTLDFPDSITGIGIGAFKGCFNLNAVKLPLNLITISDSLFDGCGIQLKGIDGKVIAGVYKGVKAVTFPSAVTSIGNYAFKNCSNLSLENGQIMNTLKTIGSGTFDGCKSITSLVIPSSLQSIGSSAFANCTNLVDVSFKTAGSLTTIGSSAFKLTGITGILRLPENLQKVESSVFQGCSNITSVELPDGLISIGSLSFKDCTSLMGSTIPAAATIVYTGSSTSFYGCNNFSNAMIKAVPATVDVSENSQIALPINCFSKINSVDVSDVNIASAQISPDMKVILRGVKEGQTKITVNGTLEYETGKDPNSGSPTINKFETKVEFNISVTSVKCTGVSFNEKIRGIRYDLKSGVQLNATMTPSNTTDLKTWTSDNESVATVSETGKVIPVSYGAATIWLEVGEQPAVSSDVRVCAPASSISLDKTSQTLVLGEATTLTPTVNYSSTYSAYKGDYPDVLLWSSSNNNIATVDSNGNVSTVGYGVATITVRADAGNVTKACTITIVPSTTNITFDKSSLNLTKGDLTTIAMTLNPENSPLSKVTVKTSNSSVAAISTNGNIITVTAKAGGTATITATPLSGTSAQCSVVVKSPLTSVTTTPMEVKKGASKNVSIVKTPTDATDVITYSSDNTNVAKVDSTGKVTGITAGTAKIKIQSESGAVSAICDVTVIVGVTGVALNNTSAILNLESSLSLTAIVSPSDASNKNVSWTSSNPNIATVDTKGVVTPVAPGTTSITVKTADGNYSARCSITVTYAFAAVITSNFPNKMTPGKEYSISFRVTNAGTETWSGSAFKLSPDQNDPFMSKLSGKMTLESGEKIKPGTVRTFTLSVTAPIIQREYTTNWNMTQNGSSFGTTLTKEIIVKMPDTVKPTIRSVTPINGAKGVSLTEDIIIQFSEPVKLISSSSNIVLVDSSKDTISKEIRFEDPSNPVKLIIHPKYYLDPSTKYTFTIAASGIQDMEGNTLKSAFVTTFNTVVLPMVISSVPFSGATKVSTNSAITVNFNENVLKGDGFENIELLDNNGIAVPYDTDLNGRIVKIMPSTDLNQDTQYKLIIPTDAIKDSLGNILTRQSIILFTTKIDKTAPLVISTMPVRATKDVKLDSSILVTFNECIQVNSDKQSGFTLVSSTESIPVEVSTNRRVLTITPIAKLSTNTNYTLTIPKEGVADLAGNKFSSIYKLTFTTTDGKSPVIKSSSPSNGATRVSLSSSISITFSKKIYKGDSFDNIILQDSDGNVCEAIMTIKNNVMTIKPKIKFLGKKSYTLIIPIGSLKDIADNVQDTEYRITFTTI